MASYSMGDLKKGLKIELDGVPYKITEYQHVKPGKGAAFVRVKIKSFTTGRVIEKTFHAGDKCEQPNMVQKTMQYLYDDGDFLQFMDTETYEQVAIEHEQMEDLLKWMLDGMMVDVLFHNGKAIDAEIPQTMTYKIVETPPNFKGDTQGGKKPATLESGAVVQVPFHILEGDTIRVDTSRGEYLEKVK
ncbi:MAG: elongation factor P [Campylobacteraceae bacterium]